MINNINPCKEILIRISGTMFVQNSFNFNIQLFIN